MVQLSVAPGIGTGGALQRCGLIGFSVFILLDRGWGLVRHLNVFPLLGAALVV